jgi:hypothetical protein
MLGETDTRRLSDIIEAGSTTGWHSFEQSLIKAFEQNLVTEETAMLFSINKSTMRQRLDLATKRRDTNIIRHSLKMTEPEPPPAPVRKPMPVPTMPAPAGGEKKFPDPAKKPAA